MRRASFDDMEMSRKILLFKDGRKSATTWAANEMAKALHPMDLTDTIIICIPASRQYTYTRHFKRFSKTLCDRCHAINGFDLIKVVGKHCKKHICKKDCSLANIIIDDDKLKGRKVIIIDDIVTTGQTADSFAKRIQETGADVRMVCFLAKTKQRFRYS